MASTTNSGQQNAGINTMVAERSKLFPLKSIGDVVKLFRSQLETPDPDLTLLSIVAGYIENTLTCAGGGGAGTGGGAAGQDSGGQAALNLAEKINGFPVVTFEIVDGLYKKFQTVLSVFDKPKSAKYPNRLVIKRISDIIWNSLIRSSYKDRAHLQNLYSYLSGNKLDCFGVAFAVVAACQFLGYRGVHLAISEDHAWVVFGKNRVETIEVTWHGKGHEDKRGQDVLAGYESRSWLYLAGHPVICDRYMEVAALVSSINPSLTLTSECLELAELQQQLLWLLYDQKHLEKYPMMLGSLGEFEEVSPSPGRPSSEELYAEATKSAQNYYKNHHVYPYTYQGGYYYRQNMYREAFASWANASDVIRLYKYSRDDEEIYKEFLEIANETIPHVMKTESSGHSAKSILRDSVCFANLLRFYDGICQWEEGSLTPILHIGWAKPLVNNISKFDYDIRSQVIINCAKDDDDEKVTGKNNDASDKHKTKEEETPSQLDEGNNNFIKSDEAKTENPTLAALTAACGEKILNPEFLLQGGGQPFADQKQRKTPDPNDANRQSENDFKSSQNSIKLENNTNNIEPKLELKNDIILKQNERLDYDEYKPKRPVITLYSQKMKGLKDLLLAEKLNTHAISLQVTAQSQVAGKKGRGDKSHHHNQNHNHPASTNNAQTVVSETETYSRPKRTRRE
ncbi:unnamed protein product [Hermetia illucens]|uniref:Menin n=1 Tax=Hermetia illucens TaxID=343691 RepID=A0A7R8UFC1_HERIL|nr:menin [Hermetia illucens]CAD7078982.1 unnamed protein product [Hermetia illucens]